MIMSHEEIILTHETGSAAALMEVCVAATVTAFCPGELSRVVNGQLVFLWTVCCGHTQTAPPPNVILSAWLVQLGPNVQQDFFF